MFSAKKSGVSSQKVCMLNLNSRDDCSFYSGLTLQTTVSINVLQGTTRYYKVQLSTFPIIGAVCQIFRQHWPRNPWSSRAGGCLGPSHCKAIPVYLSHRAGRALLNHAICAYMHALYGVL